jgi:hypothetical protein
LGGKPWQAAAQFLYGAVVLIWLVSDRRIERQLGGRF